MASKLNSKKDHELAFFYPSLSPTISTDILEIETYSNNLVVAPCIGNLVMYFSVEQPVAYLAKSWRQEGPKWSFEIREGLKCENGELISAKGFAKSLARSIRLYSQGMDHPIFKYLRGFRRLMDERLSEFEGVSASGNLLTFTFESPVHGGFLEHLAMAPFGFISEDNFTGDQWKDSTKIISSGPFRLEPFAGNDNYTLSRREDWPEHFLGDAKKVVIKRAGVDAFRKYNGVKLIETQNPLPDDLRRYGHIRQTPQNLIVVKLNADNGSFKDLNTRRVFADIFKRHLNKLSYSSSSIFKAERFFVNDLSTLKLQTDIPKNPIDGKPTLLMKVMLKGANTPNDINKDLVLEAVKDLGWSVAIDSDPYESFSETFNDPKYDLFVQAAEVGSSFEGWVIDMLFCSDVGDQWPDPSGRIAILTKEYDLGKMSKQEASQRFHDYLMEDAALIPTFHRGGFFLFSDHLDLKSLGPMVARLRFDEVKASS